MISQTQSNARLGDNRQERREAVDMRILSLVTSHETQDSTHKIINDFASISGSFCCTIFDLELSPPKNSMRD